MLRSLQELRRRPVTTWDGPLGEVEDILFDELDWRLRYLLVDLGERQTLLVPSAITFPAGDEPLTVDLSREQVLASPPLPGTPLTREDEAALHDHYGWELYDLELETDADDDEGSGVNRHLRRLSSVTGHSLRGSDGRAGELVDFIANDENWALFYMVVRLGGLLEGKKDVLLPPTWIEALEDGDIVVDLTVETIRNSRPYEPEHLDD
ncbi:MAG: hypothetical protein RRC07_10320 [Anaerolineae bacterium]|nr:hypothetical protein [Anaerolineae bacterium]